MTSRPRARTAETEPQDTMKTRRILKLVAGILRDEKSGILTCEGPGGARHVLFEDGLVVSVVADEGERLGERLVRRGLISAAQRDAALTAQADSGRRLGQILLEEGALDPATLEDELVHQAGSVLESLFTGPQVEATFQEKPFELPPNHLVWLDACPAVLEHLLREGVPNASAIDLGAKLSLRPRSHTASGELGRAVQLILREARSGKSIHELQERLGFDLDGLLRVLIALSLLGLVNLPRRRIQAAVPSPDDSVPQPDARLRLVPSVAWQQADEAQSLILEAEAHLASGANIEATAACLMALELDPKSQRARAVLERIQRPDTPPAPPDPPASEAVSAASPSQDGEVLGVAADPQPAPAPDATAGQSPRSADVETAHPSSPPDAKEQVRRLVQLAHLFETAARPGDAIATIEKAVRAGYPEMQGAGWIRRLKSQVLDRIKSVFGTPGTRPTLRLGLHKLGSAALDAEEGFVLSLIDGMTDLKSIVLLSGLDKFRAYEILLSCHERGFLA
jgi:uncharacterized protein DUF4388